jgi:hypothetical protein
LGGEGFEIVFGHVRKYTAVAEMFLAGVAYDCIS